MLNTLSVLLRSITFTIPRCSLDWATCSFQRIRISTRPVNGMMQIARHNILMSLGVSAASQAFLAPLKTPSHEKSASPNSKIHWSRHSFLKSTHSFLRTSKIITSSGCVDDEVFGGLKTRMMLFMWNQVINLCEQCVITPCRIVTAFFLLIHSGLVRGRTILNTLSNRFLSLSLFMFPLMTSKLHQLPTR